MFRDMILQMYLSLFLVVPFVLALVGQIPWAYSGLGILLVVVIGFIIDIQNKIKYGAQR